MLSSHWTYPKKKVEPQFFSKYTVLFDVALRVGDILLVVLAASLSYRIEFGGYVMSSHYTSGVIRAVLVALMVLPLAGLYRNYRGRGGLSEVGRIWLAWTVVALTLLVSAWAMKTTDTYSRVFGAIWFISTGCALTFNHLLLRLVLGWVRLKGADSQRVLLIGSTSTGRRLVQEVRKSSWTGLDVVGYVSTPYDNDRIEGLPCVGGLRDLTDQIEAFDQGQIWIALPMRAEAVIQQILHATIDKPATVRLVPDLFGYELINQDAGALAGVPVITLRGSWIEGHARLIKALEDRILAAVMLLVLCPLMLLLAAGVKLSSPGPVIYKQRRHGLGGKEIDVWKFRSMRVNADVAVVQAKRKDPRVTSFGRFLRSSSLDELPQLINVLRGHMSIVGPRPHAVEHNREYSERLRGYMQRHGVKPGMTGLAQIRGLRGETDTLEKMVRRVECDISYIREWTLWLDLKIIALTPLVLLRGTNAY